MKHVILAAAALLAFGTANAQSTTEPSALVSVTSKSGNVVVNGVTVAPGSSVSANPGDAITVEGEAVVTYANGCTLPVSGATQVAAIPATCPKPPVKASMGGGTVAAVGVGAAAVIAAVAGGGGDDSTPAPQPSSP